MTRARVRQHRRPAWASPSSGTGVGRHAGVVATNKTVVTSARSSPPTSEPIARILATRTRSVRDARRGFGWSNQDRRSSSSGGRSRGGRRGTPEGDADVRGRVACKGTPAYKRRITVGSPARLDPDHGDSRGLAGPTTDRAGIASGSTIGDPSAEPRQSPLIVLDRPVLKGQLLEWAEAVPHRERLPEAADRAHRPRSPRGERWSSAALATPVFCPRQDSPRAAPRPDSPCRRIRTPRRPARCRR